ncbi:ferredoxin reductase family protein [Hyphomicrobium sp. CS1GBMeth3]|uniref:ferredoxin reductase family protein n=1 Tax=Hyphomicrobium sp. CS1GBMeth3 TaxID=1892845 RepID=UPI000A5FFADD|nr:ferredoxin reductase family protein [Hyphomicrobium sp. CS1GBMeth3]
MNTLSRHRDQDKGSRAHSARHLGLPGAVVAVLFVVAALLPLIAALGSGIEPANTSTELATALGLTAAALLFLQFWSSGRYESISGRVGIDRTMGFHRLAACALLAFALLHPVTYLANSLFADPVATWSRLTAMMASPRLRSGSLALAGLIIIVSVAAVRTRPFVRYEVWRIGHGPLAVFVAGLVLHHATTTGTYSAETPLRHILIIFAGGALAAILSVYVVRPWRMWREDWHVGQVRRIGTRAIEMILHGPATTRLRFRAGQFIWMTLAPHRPPFHDHPFSIASAPAELPRLRLVINEVGDCTRTFERIAPGTRVAIDGPHGSFMVPPDKAPVILISGGAGIAPLLGMIEEAAAIGDRRPYRLLFAAREQGGLIYLDRLRELQLKVDLSIHCLVDAGQREDQIGKGPLQPNHVRDFVDGVDPQGAVALVCGPPRMMEVATDALLGAGVPENSVLYERFDFGAGKGRLDKARRNQELLVFLVIVVAMTAFSLRQL